VLEGLRNEAEAAARAYRARVAEVEADKRLSPVGKLEAVNAARAAYEREVGRLQDEARAVLERKVRTLPDLVNAARVAETAVLRGLLGESTRLALLARRIDAAELPELADMARGAADDWERAVVLELASLRVKGIDSEAADDVRRVLADVEAAAPWAAKRVALEDELTAARNGAVQVAALDVEAGRAELASAYGVKLDYVGGA